MTLKIPTVGTDLGDAAAYLAGILNAFSARGFFIQGDEAGNLSIKQRGIIAGDSYKLRSNLLADGRLIYSPERIER